MAEVVFRCSRFPHFWPWPRFQSHGHIVSPFSPRKDFSLLARISGAKTRRQREHRRVTPRFDAGSLTESSANSRLVAKSECAVKRRWSSAGEKSRPGTGSFHPVAIEAAAEATKLLKPSV